MAIQQLPDDVITKIAAGEVVERPGSVVKELVENAIDAHASAISIAVDEGGQRLIRVSDDGDGIRRDEVRIALQRHATSKLRSIDDLAEMQTLGFRGEALASIASISRMTLLTRHREESMGVDLRVDGGEIIALEPAGFPAGTSVKVESLFYNTPARLKFLKQPATEKRYIQTMITRLAIGYPHIRFLLEMDGQERFRTDGRGDLGDVLANVFGLEAFQSMIPLDASGAIPPGDDRLVISGYAGLPSLHHKDRTRISLFVNGRWVSDPGIGVAITQAYTGLLPPGRFPIVTLFLGLPPKHLDVNVHPTKAEVRFDNPGAIFVAVQNALRTAVSGRLSTRPSDYHGLTDMRSRQSAIQWWGGDEKPGGGIRADAGDRPREEPHTASAGPAASEGTRRRTLPILRVLGQISATYIVTEGPAGMYLVDQNAAHARVLYEKLAEAYARQGAIDTQTLAEPVVIPLQKGETRLIDRLASDLPAFGFGIESFGPDTILVRGVPALGRALDVESVVRAVLPIAVTRQSTAEDQEPARLLAALAYAGAHRRGEVLSADAQQSLIRALETCAEPLIGPEGEASIVHISQKDLADQFR
jgi:DNA mismatch repair protein MutL